MQAPPPGAAPIVVSTIQTSQRKEHYMSKAVLGLSITQVIIGVWCVLLQVALIGLRSPIHVVGQGIWTGIFFILSGSFGIVSSKKKTTCFIVTFLVLAIVSAVITIGIFMTSSIEMSFGYYFYEYRGLSRSAVYGINAVLIILAVVQAILAIISSAFSCHGLCGGRQSQPVVMAGQVQYMQGPDGQQQMMVVPFNQQGAGLPAGPSFNPTQPQLPPYHQTPPPTYESETKRPIPE